MRTSRFIGFWGLNFLATVVVDFLWHGLIFSGVYSAAAGPAIRMGSGAVQPQFGWVWLAELLITLSATYFLQKSTSPVKDAVIFVGLLMAFFGFLNQGILVSWSFEIIILDILFGVVLGLIIGLIAKRMVKS
jgi:hypothetical protein